MVRKEMIIDIREAEPKDIEQIAGFQKEMALETENLVLDNEVLLQGVTAVFEDQAKAAYFIAENEMEPVGMLMITKEWSDWRNGWVWWIQSVYTKPGFRKMGIYKLLYQHIKDIVLKADNIRGLRLYVDKRNIRAQSVYDSLGMTGEHYTTYEWMKE